jgi:uncharacterized protein (DUF2141 family)
MFAVLLDRGPVSPTTPPYFSETVNVDGEELSYSFDGLKYGDYVLVTAHDENKNHVFDVDRDGIPTEGIWIFNYDNLNPEEKKYPTFESLKFSFNEPEKSVTGEMPYPLSLDRNND